MSKADEEMKNSTEGRRYFGFEFAPFHIPLHRRLETLGALYYTCSFLLVGFLGLLLNLYIFFFTSYYYLSTLYLVWFLYDVNTCNKGSRRSEWVRRWQIWRYFVDYFPIKLIKTAEISPDKNYIFGYHPHGLMCAGAFSNFATEGTNFSEVFPGIKPHLLTLEGQFWFPIHRELLLSTGTGAATRENIKWISTQKGTGNAAVLVIGGAVEALDAHPHTYCLTLKRRKGFIKLAMKHGVHLVPVFSFGENDLFVQVKNPPGSVVRWIQDKLTKVCGFSLPFFHGRGIFQYTYGYLPYRKPIYTIVGKPIPVEKNESPTQEEVDELHEKYIQELCSVFNQFKDQYAPPGITLKII